MSDLDLSNIDSSDVDVDEDTKDESTNNDTLVQSKKLINTISEAFGASPLEDRYGRHRWIRTRMCFCESSSKTDCRFHSQSEKGWEECPNLELAKKNKNVLGRWLWATNPLYGKPPTEAELAELSSKETSVELNV